MPRTCNLLQRFPQYWPSAQTATYGEVIVEFLSEEKKGEIIIRTFKVVNSKVCLLPVPPWYCAQKIRACDHACEKRPLFQC